MKINQRREYILNSHKAAQNMSQISVVNQTSQPIIYNQHTGMATVGSNGTPFAIPLCNLQNPPTSLSLQNTGKLKNFEDQ